MLAALVVLPTRLEHPPPAKRTLLLPSDAMLGEHNPSTGGLGMSFAVEVQLPVDGSNTSAVLVYKVHSTQGICPPATNTFCPQAPVAKMQTEPTVSESRTTRRRADPSGIENA